MQAENRREKKRAYMRAYNARPDVRAKRAAWLKRYHARPANKVKRAAYDARPEVRAQRRARESKPENKAKMVAYRATPEYKAQRAAYKAVYDADPANQAKMRAYLKAYRERPEVKAREQARKQKRLQERWNRYNGETHPLHRQGRIETTTGVPIMKPEILQAAIDAVPFRPFSIVLADGERLAVLVPDCLAMGPRGRIVAWCGPGRPIRYLDINLLLGVEMEDPAS